MPYGPDFGAAIAALCDRYQHYAQFSNAERHATMRELVRLGREVGCSEERMRMIVELGCCAPGVPVHLRTDARECLIRELDERRAPGAVEDSSDHAVDGRRSARSRSAPG
jgi:hypothetical protein